MVNILLITWSIMLTNVSIKGTFSHIAQDGGWWCHASTQQGLGLGSQNLLYKKNNNVIHNKM